MISPPVIHNSIYITEIPLTCQTWSEESGRPCTVSTFIDSLENILIQIYCPAFGNLQYRTLTFYEIQTAHCYRHFTTSQELGRITTATHIFATGRMPLGYRKTSFHFLFRNFPERLHYRFIVTCLTACSIKRTRTGVDQVNETVCRLTFQFLTRYPFYGIRTPISTHIRKYLCSIGQ